MCLEVDDKISVGSDANPSPQRRLRVAVAGLGVIGEGAALRLAEADEPYVLCAALVRDPAKSRDERLSALRAYSDPNVFLIEHPDVIVDALPCGEAGRNLIEAALSRGINVVTANKQAVAGAISHFKDLAAKNNATFAYSPSVGGGAPMIETMHRARKEGEARSLTAILNGTVNYILSAMREGALFDDAVKRAQEAGFAEPDPTADLSGEDARAKVSILTYEAFGRELPLSSIKVEALTHARAAEFKKLGGAWKQLATVKKSQDGGISARVRYERVDDDPFFREIIGEGNALRVLNTDGASFNCDGKGAGRAPTVASIFADLSRIASLPPSNATNAARGIKTFS